MKMISGMWQRNILMTIFRKYKMTIIEMIFIGIALAGIAVYVYFNREKRDFLEF
jgi:hypothetical protein